MVKKGPTYIKRFSAFRTNYSAVLWCQCGKGHWLFLGKTPNLEPPLRFKIVEWSLQNYGMWQRCLHAVQWWRPPLMRELQRRVPFFPSNCFSSGLPRDAQVELDDGNGAWWHERCVLVLGHAFGGFVCEKSFRVESSLNLKFCQWQ
jgi:hypothetical protein